MNVRKDRKIHTKSVLGRCVDHNTNLDSFDSQ